MVKFPGIQVHGLNGHAKEQAQPAFKPVDTSGLHLHFIIQGFDTKMPDGTLIDMVIFDVIAKTGEEALALAQTLLEKPFYRVQQVLTSQPGCEVHRK